MSVVNEIGLKVEKDDRPQQKTFTEQEVRKARIPFAHLLYRAGLSHKEIGSFFNVSRQRVTQWLETEPDVSWESILPTHELSAA
jgi:hypothetical protein